jgi:NADPH-dependent 2,4-dienoyl-CoA reductase/sulfur reductase-like enzyme
MGTVSRRTVIKLLGAAAAAFPAMSRSAMPRVVVVGGGAGGATAARLIAGDARLRAAVTLVEPSRSYHTCFFSNLYLGGLREYASIRHDYGRLAGMERLNVVHDWARQIDLTRRRVTLGSGANLDYDRLVLSPGIDLRYASVPGYSLEEAAMAPHAWRSGTQVQLLRARALAMRQGGTFVLVAPPDPSRCPPGPYERVSMLAHLFTRHNPRAKIIILDPKERFSKQTLFQRAWEKHYPGMILWLPASMSGGLVNVDLRTLTFKTPLEEFKADAASVVPAQQAGAIVARTGLADDDGWAPIVPDTLASTRDEHVHVIGDAAVAAAMPKSAFAANSQARVAAAAMRRSLTGDGSPLPSLANTCWSQLAPDDSVKIGALYRPADAAIEAISSFSSQPDESAALRAGTAREAEAWYAAITGEMFG